MKHPKLRFYGKNKLQSYRNTFFDAMCGLHLSVKKKLLI